MPTPFTKKALTNNKKYDILCIEKKEKRLKTMYEVKNVTREVKGLVDLTVKNTNENAVELAAAWGLFAHRSLRERYTISGDSVTFRMTRKTFAEWLDIIKVVKEK